MRNKLSLVWMIVCLCLCCTITVAAENIIPKFIDYNSAQADVVWKYISNDSEQLVNGILSVSLPDKFKLVVTDPDNYGQKIHGYQDLLAVHSPSGQIEYEYESIQLFNVYKTLFIRLLEMAKFPDIYLEDETVGGRTVARYQQENGFTYWFDRETNIPLRITDESGNNILSLRQYQVDANHKEGVESFTLVIRDDDWEGVIRLGKEEGHWYPMELQVGDGHTQILVELANWQLLDQSLVFPDLQQLDTLLKEGYDANDQNDHQSVINIFRQILNIDPYYIPGYIYLAFSYSELNNFLGTVENYQQWIALEPENTVALNNLAYTYMVAETNLSQAINMAYKAVSIDPKPNYLDTLGYGYYLVKDYNKALHYLLQAMRTDDEVVLLEVLEHICLVYEALEDQQQVANYRGMIEDLTYGD